MFERVKRVLGINQRESRNGFDFESRGTNAAIVQAFLRGEDIPDATHFGLRMNDPYCQSVSVFRCVNVISSTLSQVPVSLKRKGKDISGPYRDLFYKPNKLMNLEEMIEAIIVQMLTHGNAFLFIDDPDSRGIPRALFPLPPHCISPKRGKKSYHLDSWLMESGPKEAIEIPTDRIVHFKYASHPNDPIVGVGPLVSGMLAIETDNLAAVYNRSMLRNGGMPSGILSYKGVGRLTEEMKEEIRHNWYKTYGGPRNASRLAVTNADWSWQQTGASQKDMDFIEARRWNMSDISRAFNVPLLYLNEESNFGAQAVRVQRKVFYEDNLIPLARKLGNKFTEGVLGGENKNGTFSFDFSDVAILRDDYDARVDAGVKLAKMGFSINQINENLGLGMKAEPWGDDHMVPINMVPVQDVVDHEVIVPSGGYGSQSLEEKDPATKEDEGTSLEIEEKEAAQHIPQKLRNGFYRSFQSPSGLSERCNNRLRRKLLGLRSRVLSAINPEGIDFDGIDEAVSELDIAEEIMPFLLGAYVEGAKFGIVEKGEEENSASLNGERESNYIIESAALYCEGRHDDLSVISNDIGMLVSQDLLDGLNCGEKTSDLKCRVRNIFNVAIRSAYELSGEEVFNSFETARSSLLDTNRASKCATTEHSSGLICENKE